MNQLPVREGTGQCCERLLDGEDAEANLVGRQDGDIVFGEVDAGLKRGDELDQLLLEWLKAFR